MLVLVVNNSLTPSLTTLYSWKGRGPAVATLLSPPRRGWETLDDDPLGEIARRSDVLTAARLGASCTNFFKTLLKQAWEKAMLVGLPCVLEEKVLLWDNPSNSPPLPGHGCTLTPLKLPMLRGSWILYDEQVSNGV